MKLKNHLNITNYSRWVKNQVVPERIGWGKKKKTRFPQPQAPAVPGAPLVPPSLSTGLAVPGAPLVPPSLSTGLAVPGPAAVGLPNATVPSASAVPSVLQ